MGDKGVGGSRPWFEGLGGQLSEARHGGTGDPWRLFGTSPRSLRSRADHGRVHWLVEGGDSSLQDVGTELSFLDLEAGELEDFSEWVSWDADTELRVLKSNTQRVPLWILAPQSPSRIFCTVLIYFPVASPLLAIDSCMTKDFI